MKLPHFHCKRCHHRWVPRKAERPRRCGRCKSPYWDRRPVGAKQGSIAAVK